MNMAATQAIFCEAFVHVDTTGTQTFKRSEDRVSRRQGRRRPRLGRFVTSASVLKLCTSPLKPKHMKERKVVAYCNDLMQTDSWTPSKVSFRCWFFLMPVVLKGRPS